MTENPIYDRLIQERKGTPLVSFTLEELAILAEARRACGIPDRPALMPPSRPEVNKMSKLTPVLNLWSIKQRGSQEDTQEMDTRTLASTLG